MPGAEETVLELTEWRGREAEARQQVAGFVARPGDGMVYWISQGAGPLAVNGAPLDVAGPLSDMLFTEKRGVVLTSATMTVRGGFDYVRGIDSTAPPVRSTISRASASVPVQVDRVTNGRFVAEGKKTSGRRL